MADKKLTIASYNAVSDATKDEILKAANVPQGAAKIVRDSNGKVVEVIINLPESASEAAAAAIAATPGVSSVGMTDIIPGTEGWDGTAAGVELLTTSGYYIGPDFNSVTTTFNPGGTCTLTPQMWGYSSYGVSGDVKLPSYPLASEMEHKITFSAESSVHTSSALYNDVYKGAMQVYAGMIRLLELTGQGGSVDFAVENTDSLVHTYKLALSSTGLLTVSMDSVEVGSYQLTDTTSGINRLEFRVIFSSLAGNATLDYVRWTKRP